MSGDSGLLSSVFDGLPIALHIYAFDRNEGAPALRLVSANPAAQRAFAEVDPDLAASVAALCERVADSGETATTGRIDSVGERALRLSAFPLEGDRIGVSFEDLTALEAAHTAALQAGKLLLQHTLDCVPATVFVKSPDDTYLVVNRACAALAGGEPEQFPGKKNRDFFPPEASDAFEAMDRKIFAEGKSVSFEEQVPVRDNQTLISLTTKTPIYDEDGQPLFLVGVSQDITERKRAEEEAQRNQSTLRQ
ncbi:MAG: PAS domain-containing protein, partial [Myxococcales bacterium]|nr:PAS domain-containing protein [Myxococcales bacterium]